MANFDVYPRGANQDAGLAASPGAQPSAGLQPVKPEIIMVPYVAAAGTTRDVAVVCPRKCRVVDSWVTTVTGVGSSVITLRTAAAGAGTALSSAMATSSSGALARNALVTATGTIAAGGTLYAYQSGGASVPGGELFVLVIPEQ